MAAAASCYSPRYNNDYRSYRSSQEADPTLTRPLERQPIGDQNLSNNLNGTEAPMEVCPKLFASTALGVQIDTCSPQVVRYHKASRLTACKRLRGQLERAVRTSAGAPRRRSSPLI
ncbi:hypothetical protein EVAR_7516_1 [Eumeta japonica]|uniref:Uncharacterized protein n=1 Tax=Eumeta variegata TaxID=151549 RepID=A0A4C2AA02_EUMVA|nr:hypothetical protein EVAR_7516_1 [Eumeta japonica]